MPVIPRRLPVACRFRRDALRAVAVAYSVAAAVLVAGCAPDGPASGLTEATNVADGTPASVAEPSPGGEGESPAAAAEPSPTVRIDRPVALALRRPAARPTPAVRGPFLVPPDREIALVGARVIDGSHDAPREGWTLVIRGDRIVAAGPDVEPPPGAERIDLAGRTVLPGLIDVHGHLFGLSGNGYAFLDAYPRLYLAGGVTTVFAPGEWEPEAAIAARDAIARGDEPGPRVLTAGPFFDGAGGGELLVRRYERWRDRIDGVKVYSQVGPEALGRLIDAAHADGLRVTGHLGSTTVAEALALGIDRLEHGVFAAPELWPGLYALDRQTCAIAELDPDGPEVGALVDAILESRTPIVPTFTVYAQSMADAIPVDDEWLRFVAPEARKGVLARTADYREASGACVADALAVQSEFVRRIHEGGGIVLAGTDPVYPLIVPGAGLHRELAHLVDAGLTPLAAIQAATVDAARALGLDDRGAIEAGRRADLMVVGGDPSVDIADVARVEWVMQGGVRHDPEALRTEVEGAIGRAATATVP